MLRNLNWKSVVWLIGGLLVISYPAVSYAWEDNHRGRLDRQRYYRHQDRGIFGTRVAVLPPYYTVVGGGVGRYYYYDGWYYSDMGNAYVWVSPPVGAIVPNIPAYYQPVIINGMTYYTDNGVYYMFTRNGYRVVNPPRTVVIAEPVYSAVPNQTKVAEGMGLGGILGALTGGIIGHQMKGNNDLRGAIIGGVAGAAVGGIVGAQMPSQSVVDSTLTEWEPTIGTSQTMTEIKPIVDQPVDYSNEEFKMNIPNAQGGYTLLVIKRSGTGFIGPQGEFYPEFPKVSQLREMYAK